MTYYYYLPNYSTNKDTNCRYLALTCNLWFLCEVPTLNEIYSIVFIKKKSDVFLFMMKKEELKRKQLLFQYLRVTTQ